MTGYSIRIVRLAKAKKVHALLKTLKKLETYEPKVISQKEMWK